MKLNQVFMLAVALALYANPLTAQPNAKQPRQCSMATLNGSYGFFGEAPATLVGDSVMRLVISGVLRFDGKGNLSGESISNVEGWGAGGVGTFAGTYTVNPDCTYSGEHTGGGETLHFVGTITGSGMMQQTRFVVTDPGWVALGTVKKIQPAACSLATLRGSYALYGQGAVTALTPPAPIAHVGTATYDGAGSLFGGDTIMLNGMSIQDTYTATYTITEQCMVSLEITSTAVGVLHEVGWVVGTGKSQEVHFIGTDPGLMFVEAIRKQ